MDFDKIYKSNVALLMHITKSFGLSKEQGDEIVQDVFLKFHENNPNLESSKVKSYLAVMTKNLCIDLIRKKQFQKTDSSDQIEKINESEPIWYTDRHKNKLMHSVYKAAQEISANKGCEEFREYYVEGRSLAKIAAEKNTPKGTIQARVHRCRKKFEQRIKELIVNSDDSNVGGNL